MVQFWHSVEVGFYLYHYIKQTEGIEIVSSWVGVALERQPPLAPSLALPGLVMLHDSPSWRRVSWIWWIKVVKIPLKIVVLCHLYKHFLPFKTINAFGGPYRWHQDVSFHVMCHVRCHNCLTPCILWPLWRQKLL